MSRLILFIYVINFLISQSCTNQKVENSFNTPPVELHLDFRNIKENTLNLSMVADKIKYIPLETSNYFLNGENKKVVFLEDQLELAE